MGGQISVPWKERSVAVRATKQQNGRPPNVMNTAEDFFLPDYSCHLCAAMAGCRAHPRLFLWRMILPEHLQKDMLGSSRTEAKYPPPKSRRSSSFWGSVLGQELNVVPSQVCSEAACLGALEGKDIRISIPVTKK